MFGALFQVGMTGAAISEVVDEGPPSLVEPAGYAFGVWALIFVLSLVYAGYQALPASRESPLLRRIRFFTAGAFFCTGLWSVFVPLRQLLAAQAMLLGIFAFLLVAYLRLARSERGVLGGADRWLVALPLGPFLGWVTAANAVSLTSEAVRLGLVESGGAGEALLGAALLLVGGTLAAAVVWAGRTGPAQGYLAYGFMVLWGRRAEDRRYYEGMRQAPFAPPGWVFGPAWAINNTSVLWGNLRLLNQPKDTPNRRELLALQGLSWVLFSTFSYVYFRKGSPILALVWTAAFLVLTVVSAALSWRSDRKVTLSFATLLAWLTLATPTAAYQAASNPDELFGTPAWRR